LSFRHIKEFSPDWIHNQGFINSRVEMLWTQDKDRMQEYVKTLTDDEKDLARSHLQTVLNLEKGET